MFTIEELENMQLPQPTFELSLEGDLVLLEQSITAFIRDSRLKFLKPLVRCLREISTARFTRASTAEIEREKSLIEEIIGNAQNRFDELLAFLRMAKSLFEPITIHSPVFDASPSLSPSNPTLRHSNQTIKLPPGMPIFGTSLFI